MAQLAARVAINFCDPLSMSCMKPTWSYVRVLSKLVVCESGRVVTFDKARDAPGN